MAKVIQNAQRAKRNSYKRGFFFRWFKDDYQSVCIKRPLISAHCVYFKKTVKGAHFSTEHKLKITFYLPHLKMIKNMRYTNDVIMMRQKYTKPSKSNHNETHNHKLNQMLQNARVNFQRKCKTGQCKKGKVTLRRK